MDDQEKQTPITDAITDCREAIEKIGSEVRGLMNHPEFSDTHTDRVGQDKGEMKANIMLAYRHLEDARMRLGKVFQAHDGGTSVYPR